MKLNKITKQKQERKKEIEFQAQHKNKAYIHEK